MTVRRWWLAAAVALVLSALVAGGLTVAVSAAGSAERPTPEMRPMPAAPTLTSPRLAVNIAPLVVPQQSAPSSSGDSSSTPSAPASPSTPPVVVGGL